MKERIILNNGDVFGKLTVSCDTPIKRGHSLLWKCYCECDTDKSRPVYVQSSDLIRGHTTSCGCERSRIASKKTTDLTGMVFGDLTVLNRIESDKNTPIKYTCMCSCGNIITVNHGNLQSGNTKSCGHNHRTGVSKDRLHHIWVLMNDRCTNKRSAAYKNYGGRGIFVCEEWANDYSSFKDWSLNNGYSRSLTIDRIDVNRGYCPDNCRWATPKEQANNTRRNTYINGMKFGMLTVVGRVNSEERMYLCKCDCGNHTVVSKYHLTNGHTKSCGCLRGRQRNIDTNTIELIPEMYVI